MCYDFEESELHHSIVSLMDKAHPRLRTDRDYLMKDNQGRPQTFETAKGKKENHFSFFPFAVSNVSNGQNCLSLDDLYWSSDLGEPCPSGSLCCDDAQTLQNQCVHYSIIFFTTTNQVNIVHALHRNISRIAMPTCDMFLHHY